MMMISYQTTRTSHENLSRYRSRNQLDKSTPTMYRQSDEKHTKNVITSEKQLDEAVSRNCRKMAPASKDSHFIDLSEMSSSSPHRRGADSSQSWTEKSRRRLTSLTDVHPQCSFEEEETTQPLQIKPQDEPRDDVDKGYHTDPCILTPRKRYSERLQLADPSFVESSESSEDTFDSSCTLEQILSKGTGLELEEGPVAAFVHYDSVVSEGLVEGNSCLAHLEYRMGILLWKCGSYEKSLDVLRRAKHLLEQEGGMEVRVLAEIHFAIGRTLSSLGKRKKARKYFMKALRTLEYDQFVDNNVKPEDQELYARILAQVASLLVCHGNYEMASEVLSEAITMQRSMLPPEHSDIAATLQVYGALNEALSRYEYAAKCYLEALEIYRNNRSTTYSSSVDISVTLSNIGWLFYLTQDYSSALHSYEEALELVIPILGDNHRNVLSLQVQMGMVYAQQGNHKSALKAYRTALRGQRQVLGDEHEDVALTLALVGAAYKETGKYHKAIEFTQLALEMRQQVAGPASIAVGMTFAQLGQIYMETQEYANASHCFSCSLSIYFEHNVPSSDSRVVEARSLLAKINNAIDAF